ncbi:hypothetical protein SSX86_005467 [Deinandra increscens subsp. villosa]|uniref:non-specific serine/threonine protein kinase n=1 Tax=Deinandra increscens subsp. villosa TaxID=3103831 RepID=A0AAP0H9U8_9ASTR
MSILACLFFLALIPNYASSITFNFTDITPEEYSKYIQPSNDAAYNLDEGIQLTHFDPTDSIYRKGQATYMERLHLWDKNSTYLASFSTSFTFVIDSNGSSEYGDGLTFFLSQNVSMTKGGRSIGLPYDYANKTSIHPFVAVEFDSYGRNMYDPKDMDTGVYIGDHVGININSMISVVYKKWFSGIPQGKECRALINYFSDSKKLSVSFTNFINNSLVWETGLDYTVDLRDVLPEWVIFGFSAGTGSASEKTVVRSWTFSCIASSGKGNNNTLHKVEVIAGAVVVVIVIVLAISDFFLWRMKNKDRDKVEELKLALEMNNEFEMEVTTPRRFSYRELARSTANFAETKKLGEGGFGGVYKGFLKDLSIYVAVKRVSRTSQQGIKEYASEVRIISRLRHKNLVQLTGWCHEKGELLLVYEFMENGSLDLHLFQGKSLLTWNTRYKIALGLACALLYLHDECEQCVLHRDIKSSNVMLDSNFNAKLGDFGLAKLVDHEKGSHTTILAGTLGYMAPEYVATARATKESDVFSFGVVALEIACGRKVINYTAQERQTRLLEWVWELYGKDRLREAIDPSLGSEFEEEEIRRLMIIGLWCVHPDSELRPSIREVIKVLNSEASPPLLPSKMPVASYVSPPLSSLSDFSSNGQYQSSSRTIEHLKTESPKQTTSFTSSSSSRSK